MNHRAGHKTTIRNLRAKRHQEKMRKVDYIQQGTSISGGLVRFLLGA